jgi:2-polyprenyl-3-methyl-5-hydroxy-6-metoxy-1,4-benzoquinol methylase
LNLAVLRQRADREGIEPDPLDRRPPPSLAEESDNGRREQQPHKARPGDNGFMPDEQPVQEPPTAAIDHGDVEIISKVQQFSFVEGWYELTAESHFWFQWRLAALLRQLTRLGIPLTAPFSVLEIGGGTGVLRSQIERSTRWRVDMTDLDMEALKRSKPGRGRIMYYDICEERDRFLQAYDVVVLFDVLEHIPHTQPFLRSVVRHIKPNGLLLINVPALSLLYSKYDETVGHVRRFNKKTLADEVSPFNLEIQDLRYWGMTMVPLLAARKLALKMLTNGQDRRVVSCGFKPPNPLVHSVLRAMMRLETTLLSEPPLGSSVLMAARKVQ